MGDATARPRQAPFFALFASTIQQHRSGNAVPIDVVEMRGLGRSDAGYSQGTPMTRTHVAAIAVVVSIGLAASTAQAQSPTEQGRACIGKGGRGTGSSVEDARFQAWEAVLQATSWPMWAAWMTSGATVGQAAAGYTVRKVRQRCGNGGALGKECIIRAKLCPAS